MRVQLDSTTFDFNVNENLYYDCIVQNKRVTIRKESFDMFLSTDNLE